MTSLPPAIHSEIVLRLRELGRLKAGDAISAAALAGNAQRSDYGTLTRFVIKNSTGESIALLTLGNDLNDRKNRAGLFHAAYPDLACPLFASGTIEGNAYHLETFFNGLGADRALVDPQIGTDGVIVALQTIAAQFRRAEQPSSSSDARAELEQLFDRILHIGFWTSADRGFLAQVVFPFAEKLLLATVRTKRVTNGDFTLGNILIGSDGTARVIDYEQAAETHFHSEDWLRLTYWSAPKPVRDFALQQIPSLPAAQLYLWLRQLALEAEINNPEKAREHIRFWAGEIRTLVCREDATLKDSLSWPFEYDLYARQALRLHASANVSHRELQQRNEKIRQMENSFSWRATGWLRALRRRFLDPYRSQPTPPKTSPPALFSDRDLASPLASQLHFHVDTPTGDFKEGSCIVRGWVFATRPIILSGIRARIGERTYDGQYGLERLDVDEKFLPQAFSRFEIAVTVQAADTQLRLEVADGYGEWMRFHSIPLVNGCGATKS